MEKGAELGFPSVAFKTAAGSAGFRTGVPGMREDMVRVGMGPRISVTGGVQGVAGHTAHPVQYRGIYP